MNEQSTTELIQLALADTDPDEINRWQIIDVLGRRGTRDVFETARQLCLGERTEERRLGCDLLGRLASSAGSDFDEWLMVLLPMLESEYESCMLERVISALGHSHDPRVVAPVARFQRHPDTRVRWHVVLTLTACGERDDSLAVLIDFTKDAEPLVRDWACHGLGTEWDMDTPALRDALAACLSDPDEIVRGEAMVGLARRRDERVLAPLARELAARTYENAPNDYAKEALEALGDLSQFPQLGRWSTLNDKQ